MVRVKKFCILGSATWRNLGNTDLVEGTWKYNFETTIKLSLSPERVLNWDFNSDFCQT